MGLPTWIRKIKRKIAMEKAFERGEQLEKAGKELIATTEGLVEVKKGTYPTRRTSGGGGGVSAPKAETSQKAQLEAEKKRKRELELKIERERNQKISDLRTQYLKDLRKIEGKAGRLERLEQLRKERQRVIDEAGRKKVEAGIITRYTSPSEKYTRGQLERLERLEKGVTSGLVIEGTKMTKESAEAYRKVIAGKGSQVSRSELERLEKAGLITLERSDKKEIIKREERKKTKLEIAKEFVLGEKGEKLVGVSIPRGGLSLVKPDVTFAEAKKFVRKGGLAGKVVGEFIPTTPAEIALFGGGTALAGGVAGKTIAKGTQILFAGGGVTTAFRKDLPPETRIAGGIIATLGGAEFLRTRGIDLVKGKTITEADIKALSELKYKGAGVEVVKESGGKATIRIKSKKQLGRVGAEQDIVFELEKVKGGYQITKGKGIQRLTKEPLLFRDKDVVIKEKFTFFGEAQPTKAVKIKELKDIKGAVVEQLPSKVQPIKGKIELLGFGDEAKLIKQDFIGFAQRKKDVTAVIGKRIESTTLKRDTLKIFDERTGLKVGEVIVQEPKRIARFKPSEIESMTFIKKIKPKKVGKVYEVKELPEVKFKERKGKPKIEEEPKDLIKEILGVKPSKPIKIESEQFKVDTKQTVTKQAQKTKSKQIQKTEQLSVFEKEAVAGVTGEAIQEAKLIKAPVKKESFKPFAVLTEKQKVKQIGQIQKQISKEKLKVGLKQKQMFATKQKQKERQAMIQIEEPTIKQKQEVRPTQILKSMQKLLIKQKQSMKMKPVAETIPVIPEPKPSPKIKITPTLPSKPEVIKEAEKVLGSFKIFVTKRGKEVEIGEAPTLEKAKKKLKLELLETLRAGGYVKKGGKKVKIKLGFGFAPSKVDPFKVIQKKERRFGTKTEVREAHFFKKRKGGTKTKFI